MKRALCLLPGLSLIGACVTTPTPVEVQGVEAFVQACPDEPAALSDQEALALYNEVQVAVSLPTPEERDVYLRTRVLEPMIQREQSQRHCSLYERQRADRLVALVARFNQMARED